MTHADLYSAMLEVLKSYWRIRNITELVRATNILRPDLLIEYQGVHQVNGAPVFPSNEKLELSVDAICDHATKRMASDYFLILISKYEHFLSSRLKAAGQPGHGTLGQLQKAAEQKFGLSGDPVRLGSEIRERRNCIVHNNGKADLKYINSAKDAAAIGKGYVSLVAVGDTIVPPPDYLSFAADSLLKYSSSMP
ncbi:hypothetical protein [Archangium violaceum]|uniref:hypothetical protein n=1 Tax=Archangium violaceum TaxID=83451 RepID=UPI0036DEB7D7